MAMTATELAEQLVFNIHADVPAFIWGSPGIGKSQLVNQVATALGYQVEDIRTSSLDPVDFRGLPRIDVANNRTTWAAPDFLPTGNEPKPVLIFLDELNAALPVIQAPCYQLVHERRVGRVQLPESTRIVAAGNLETDGAITHRLSTALRSRFDHFEMIAEIKAWEKWAAKNGIPLSLIAFLKFRPELLHKFDKTARTFPCPRTWEFVAKKLALNIPMHMLFDATRGIVGDPAATELVGFLRVWKSLPSLDGIIVDPTGSDVPTDPATLYAIAGGLSRKATDVNIGNVITYACRMPKDLEVFTVISALRRDKAIANTRPYIQWAADNGDVMV